MFAGSFNILCIAYTSYEFFLAAFLMRTADSTTKSMVMTSSVPDIGRVKKAAKLPLLIFSPSANFVSIIDTRMNYSVKEPRSKPCLRMK